MGKPDIRQSNTGTKGLESKKGEQRRMSGDSAGTCSPSLGFNPNSEYVSEDIALDHLASILAEIYLYHISHANNRKKSGDILPGINKGAS